MIYWTRRQSGIPVSRDFDITGGFGTAIIIDETTDIGYYLTTEGEVKPLIGGGPVKEDSFIVVCSTEYGALTASTTVPKVTFRCPFDFLLTEVTASLTTAQTSGSICAIDVRVDGTSIFSTTPTIDNGETTSTTAVTPGVFTITPTIIAKNAIITLYLLTAGVDGTGLKITLTGFQG